MSLASVIGLSACALAVAVLCGSAEARRLVRRSGAAVVNVERRYHLFSTGITLAVAMAALFAGTVLLIKALIDSFLASLS